MSKKALILLAMSVMVISNKAQSFQSVNKPWDMTDFCLNQLGNSNGVGAAFIMPMQAEDMIPIPMYKVSVGMKNDKAFPILTSVREGSVRVVNSEGTTIITGKDIKTNAETSDDLIADFIGKSYDRYQQYKKGRGKFGNYRLNEYVHVMEACHQSSRPQIANAAEVVLQKLGVLTDKSPTKAPAASSGGGGSINHPTQQ